MDLRKVKKSKNVIDNTNSFTSKVMSMQDPPIGGGFRPKKSEGLMDKWEPLKQGNSWFNRVNLRKKK